MAIFWDLGFDQRDHPKMREVQNRGKSAPESDHQPCASKLCLYFEI